MLSRTDDWRIANNLTLILGMRYEYFSPWQEEYGHIANLDIAPGFAAVAPVTPGQIGPLTGALYPAALINPDRHDFGPRTGIAWKPSAKSRVVFRAGYGIYYTPNQYNKFESNLSAQPPFAVTNYHHDQQRRSIDFVLWTSGRPSRQVCHQHVRSGAELPRYLHPVVEFLDSDQSAQETSGRNSLYRHQDNES